MYLLDTNVISELRKHTPHGAVRAWLDGVDDAALHLSAVTLGEVQAGIELTREQDAAKAEEIERWLRQVERSFRVIPADGAVFRRWAKLMHRQSESLLEDALIGATAQVYGLTLVTRNTKDFTKLGISTVNPFL